MRCNHGSVKEMRRISRDLIAAELQSKPDIDDTPETGVVDVSQFFGGVMARKRLRQCNKVSACLSVLNR